jgi:hypothetical protein
MLKELEIQVLQKLMQEGMQRALLPNMANSIFVPLAFPLLILNQFIKD